jgi:hypothetical protein
MLFLMHCISYRFQRKQHRIVCISKSCCIANTDAAENNITKERPPGRWTKGLQKSGEMGSG